MRLPGIHKIVQIRRSRGKPRTVSIRWFCVKCPSARSTGPAVDPSGKDEQSESTGCAGRLAGSVAGGARAWKLFSSRSSQGGCSQVLAGHLLLQLLNVVDQLLTARLRCENTQIQRVDTFLSGCVPCTLLCHAFSVPWLMLGASANRLDVERGVEHRRLHCAHLEEQVPVDEPGGVAQTDKLEDFGQLRNT